MEDVELILGDRGLEREQLSALMAEGRRIAVRDRFDNRTLLA
jgi:hypothetical protein